MNIAIIGGGAAGFFAAINITELAPNAKVTIYEGSARVLAKVAISGGGRCNLTNSFEGINDLAHAYPRGAKLMKRAFKLFDYNDTKTWFEECGVELVTQDDKCLFPRSQDSHEIIDTLLRLARERDVEIKLSHRVAKIKKEEEKFNISFQGERDIECDIVVVTTGGISNNEGLPMFSSLPVDIIEPVPSLFTFNIPNDPITELMGTVVEEVLVSLQGTSMRASGPLLITHWGMSGPAVLKLSSYAARALKESKYHAKLSVNWVNEKAQEKVSKEIDSIIKQHRQKLITNVKPYNLPTRLWLRILDRAEVSHERRWAELGQKGINRIVNILTNDEYVIDGQSRFTEEFVTAGGVSLASLNFSTLECRKCDDLYFAGEVVDIDAITGGFNLQAAWSTGYLVAHSIANKLGASN